MVLFERIAGLVVARPARVLLGAGATAALAIAFGLGVTRHLQPFGFDDPASESVRARTALERATGASAAFGIVALVRSSGDVRASPRARAEVQRVARVLRADPAVAEVRQLYSTGSPAFVSLDGRETYVAARLRAGSDKRTEHAARRIQRELHAEAPGVLVGGGAVAFREVDRIVESDLFRAEALAFPLLLVLAIVVFRGLVAAALVPLAGALTIVCSFLALRLATEAVGLSVFSLNLVTGMSLGLSIDWSLLLVSRFREELEASEPAEAVATTVRTAGRTVFFSSLTVAAAMAALLVFPQQFLYSMGIGGVLTALVGGAVALVVLPAALALLGRRVNALAPARWQRRSARPATAGGWYRLSHAVMRHALPVAIAASAVLLALGSPFHRIRFTSADARVLPSSSETWQVDHALRTRFPPYRLLPAYVVLDRAPPAGLAARLAALPGTAAVLPPRKVGPETWRADVIPAADPLSAAARRLVGRVRALVHPLGGRVGGETAEFADQRASLRAHLPLAFAIVALGTMLVVFVMTGSAVLPVKSLLMNLLTLSAAYGVLVLVFQDGRLEGLLGYTSPGALDFTQPILIFAIVFALSTDYGVFLLSRIREEHDRGRSNEEAVAVGLERTGRIVTAAALLFCVAIGAFSTSRIVFVKELGVGIAAAVVIDATIVRAFLVPSLMKLLGHWNWWAPEPLRRLHRRLGPGIR